MATATETVPDNDDSWNSYPTVLVKGNVIETLQKPFTIEEIKRLADSNPECQALSMETRDQNNVSKVETAYVTTSDIQGMDPCWFTDKRNPITGKTCIEAFGNINNVDKSKMPDSLLIKVYYSALGLLGLYILMKMFERKEK